MGEKVFFLSGRDRCAEVYQHVCKIYQHMCKIYKHECKIYKHVCKTDGGAAVQKSAKICKICKMCKTCKVHSRTPSVVHTPPPPALTFLSL